MWRTWHIISPQSEKSEGTRPACPPPNYAHGNGMRLVWERWTSVFVTRSRASWRVIWVAGKPSL